MPTVRETVLSVVSHASTSRVIVAVRELHEKPIVLRSESFSPDIGWYTQQELTLTRTEFAGLKNVLGIQVPKSCERTLQLTEQAAVDHAPSIYSFADAVSRRA